MSFVEISDSISPMSLILYCSRIDYLKDEIYQYVKSPSSLTTSSSGIKEQIK